MENPNYTIRRVTVSDAATIARHRVGMFRDMGQVPTDALADALLESSTSALAESLCADAYVGWFAVDDNDRVLAGAGVDVKRQLPRISHDGRRVLTEPIPVVVNVYTEPDCRGRGIARALMRALMNWAGSHDYDRLVLHASDAGRALYLSLGFLPTNEMRWSPAD